MINLLMKEREFGFLRQKKEKFKQLFPVINDKDLYFRLGNEREMIERLGYKLGKSNQELLQIIVGL